MAGQVLCEKICLELPQVLVQFVNLSTVCQALCLNIIEALLESCNAREIFAVLMEVFYLYLLDLILGLGIDHDQSVDHDS